MGEEAAIFPCVMAWAATLLKREGHEVRWLDGPAMGWNWDRYLLSLRLWKPDLICWEAKTPSIKRVWEKVRAVKTWLPNTVMVLVGDHVTALPEETLTACPVNYVLTGGDYDFALQHLLSHMVGSSASEIRETPTTTPLTTLPVIDRTLCQWKLYSRMGNYLYRPGTHGYSARDCWWRHEGGCTFCSWTNTFKNYRQLSVDQFMTDVESAHALGAKEYFDDAGTWPPTGVWFKEAVTQLERFNGGASHGKAKICLGCNDRPGTRKKTDYLQMARAGFRFVLYGLESANLDTLEKINKGQKAEDMRNAAKWASEAGLQPHLTVMLGYPWESQEDAAKTVSLVRELFDRGWANSLQATLLMPYPGTRLFQQAQENGWLLTQDWNDWTMTKRVLNCPMTDEEVLEKIRECYKAAVTPRYLLKKVLTVRTKDDLRFFWRGFRFFYGHLTDFRQRAQSC